MKCCTLFAPACLAVVGLAATFGTFANAQPAKEAKPAVKPAAPTQPATTPAQPGKAPAGQPEMPLPPGWTTEDMQKCMTAMTPGAQQEFLTKQAGTWQGKQTMWMMPGAEPTKSDVTSTTTSIMDGRFVKTEVKGDMPGMGPFNGVGVYGFDNVAQKYVASWIDNMSTGMMTGTGELSADKKTMTWTYDFNCPLQNKPVKMREVHHYTGENSMTMEMYGPEPKSGKEYKMMVIEFTRKS